MEYINYNDATLIWVKFYYNGVRQSFYFDDMFIFNGRLKSPYDMKVLKQLLGFKIPSDIDAILEECAYMDSKNLTYKVFASDYFLSNNLNDLHLREIKI